MNAGSIEPINPQAEKKRSVSLQEVEVAVSGWQQTRAHVHESHVNTREENESLAASQSLITSQSERGGRHQMQICGRVGGRH